MPHSVQGLWETRNSKRLTQRLPGVDVVAHAHLLPFPANLFTRVECDAVLEHVRQPEEVMREIERVLAPGGFAHIVTPFCHPHSGQPQPGAGHRGVSDGASGKTKPKFLPNGEDLDS